MKYNFLALVIACLTIQFSFAQRVTFVSQDIEYKDYSWEDEPNFDAPNNEKDYSEIIIKDKEVLEYLIEDEKYFIEYNLKHTVTYIAKEAGVEQNNKIYLSKSEYEDVVMQKARVINSKGEIIVFNDKDIQEGVDEESGYTFQYFALDGLDIGSFVEIIFLTKKPAKYNGSKVTLQTTVPKYNVEFELICKKHLIFDFLSTNDLKEVSLNDTLYEEKNIYSLVLDTLEAHEFEPISYGRSNLKSLIYKIDENTATGAKNITSYSSVVQNYYNYVYDVSKADEKAIQGLLKKIGIKPSMKAEDKVKMLEHYIKENYAVLEYVPYEYQGIKALLDNKASDDASFLKLYANAFKQMDIKSEIILSSDRTVNKFDENFEANNYLQTGFFYLPTLDKYLSPEAADLRLGFIPWEYTNTYGLFIKTLKIGDISTGVGEVKFIEALPHTETAYDHFIKVDMTDDPFEPIISFDVQMSGYMSSFLQTSYHLLSDDEKKRTNESLIEMIVEESANAENLTIENATPEQFGKEPVSLQVEVKSLNFTEKAGNKVLFKVGELIGEQSELYNEEPRQSPIENDFNRTFYREIEVLLPEGYEVSNLDKLNFNNRLEDGTAVFTSKYELNGNLLKIIVDEYYSRIDFTLDEFEAYKDVINAAADFNKVVLYLTEK